MDEVVVVEYKSRIMFSLYHSNRLDFFFFFLVGKFLVHQQPKAGKVGEEQEKGLGGGFRWVFPSRLS